MQKVHGRLVVHGHDLRRFFRGAAVVKPEVDNFLLAAGQAAEGMADAFTALLFAFSFQAVLFGIVRVRLVG